MKVNKEEVKRLRENMPMNVQDMAAKLKVTPQTVHRIEREGKTSWKTVKKLAKIHGVEVTQIIKGSGDEELVIKGVKA